LSRRMSYALNIRVEPSRVCSIADVDPLAQVRVPLRAGSGAAGATQAADSYEYSATSAASSTAAAATNGTATDSAAAANGTATDSATATSGAADTGMSA